jgi:hypothetical protein
LKNSLLFVSIVPNQKYGFCCVLFSRLFQWDSYDAVEKHKDLKSLQDCFYATQEILSANGGFIRQFLVDDKGCVLIACWGVPTASYIDNGQRALSSAVLIRDKLQKLDMNCSFGITTGNVYCGTVGNTLRCEYAMVRYCYPRPSPRYLLAAFVCYFI